MAHLTIAALVAFPMRFQQTVHGANGAMKPTFIEQRRVDLRGAILNTLLMKARGQSRRLETASAKLVPSGARNRSSVNIAEQ